MRQTPSSALAAVVVLGLVSGCGGPAGGIQHGGLDGQSPPTLGDENVHEVERAYWRMEPGDPARIVWRDALVAFRSGRTAEVMAHGNYDEVVQHLADLAALLTPADVQAGAVPSELAPLARWVVEHGSPRGDEGRVMGALLLLGAIGEGREEHHAERERIERWGRDARSGIDNPVERYGNLIRVWEQQEQLAPAPEVLTTLARLYVEQRDALMVAFGPEGQGSRTAGRLSMHELRLAPLLVQRAPLDVAAVYLRHGDLERAAEHVRRMGANGRGMERDIVRILERAQQNGEPGANALDELARGFARARPSIAASICRLGARRFPTDARFALCLARVAIEAEHLGEATSWYAEAVRLAPGDRDVYDEALDRIAQRMDQGMLQANLAESHAVAQHTLEILDERMRRWPDSAPAVAREQLLMSIARSEMTRGNVREARARLLAALEARESREAHVLLGLLLERTGEPAQAADHYRRALDLPERSGPEGGAGRAELLEHLGDAFRQAGEERQAERMYRQALALWNELVRQRGARTAEVQVRRGILQSRLGDERAAAQAFGAAMDAAPSWREPYAAILSHLVVSPPNLELAQHVLRRAQFQLTLEREWKVYFALWVQVVATRASSAVEQDVTYLLADEARGDSWSARLANFGRGELDYAGLLAAAHDRGEQTEAHFYQAARLLGAGDAAGAQRLFEQVLESGMVGLAEYAMAQELLTGMASRAAQVAAEARPAR